MKFRLLIDRVIVERRTMTLAERKKLQSALQAELGRLFGNELISDRAILRRFTASPRFVRSMSLAAGPPDVAGTPTTLGSQVAAALHGGLTR
jgi:hypothetical protein